MPGRTHDCGPLLQGVAPLPITVLSHMDNNMNTYPLLLYRESMPDMVHQNLKESNPGTVALGALNPHWRHL